MYDGGNYSTVVKYTKVSAPSEDINDGIINAGDKIIIGDTVKMYILWVDLLNSLNLSVRHSWVSVQLERHYLENHGTEPKDNAF